MTDRQNLMYSLCAFFLFSTVAGSFSDFLLPLSFSPLVLGLSVLDFSGLLLALWGGLLRALLGARGAGLRGAVCGTGLLGVLLGAVARRAPSTGLAGISSRGSWFWFSFGCLCSVVCAGGVDFWVGVSVGFSAGGAVESLVFVAAGELFFLAAGVAFAFGALGLAFLESLEAPGIGSAELVAVAWSFIS